MSTVSVVTVTWNNLLGLQETVRSLVRQDYPFQHVVIDGASIDGSQSWYHNHPVGSEHLWISEPDNGIFDAMNKGLKLATGDLIAFLNAGDLYADSGAIRRQVEGLGDREWGYGVEMFIGAGGERRYLQGPRPYSVRKHAYGMNWIPHQATICRTKAVRDVGGFETSYRIAGDFHLLLRLGLRGAPATWDSIDVVGELGGVSMTDWRGSLREIHAARVEVLSRGRVGKFFDRVYSAGQAGTVWLRKLARSVVGRVRYASSRVEA